jgi:hypothetical protein
MKMYFGGLIIVLFAIFTGSCSVGGAQTAIGDPPVVGDVAATTNCLSSRSISANTVFSNLPETDDQYFTPSSFIIRVGTIGINDEMGGYKNIFDEPDDLKCPSIDLAKGQKLSDIVTASSPFAGDRISSLIFAILPSIQYSYIDNTGTERSGTIDIGASFGGTGNYAQYGSQRNRWVADTVLGAYGNWGDSSIALGEGSDRSVTVYIDLDYIILRPNGGDVILNGRLADYLFPAAEGMYYELYYFRKTGSGSAYPYKARVLYAKNGQPVFGEATKTFYNFAGTEIDGLTSFYSHSRVADRDTVFQIGNDARITLLPYPGSGSAPLGPLDKADMTAVPYGSTFYDTKYFRRIIAQ